GAIAGADKERVIRFDDDEVIDANGGDEFRGAVEKIARSIERLPRARENIFVWLLGEQLVDGGPGANVAPTNFSREDEDLRRAGLLGGALDDGVIHGNVFEFLINSAEFLFVSASADRGSEFFKFGMRFGEMALEIVEESRNAPEEHSGVPLIVSARNVLLR